MTAHKEQDERIILIRFNLDIRRRRQTFEFRGRSGFAATAGQLAAQVIGHTPGGHLNQPGPGIVWNAFARPLNRRREQCLLNGVLGIGEVPETADDRAEHLRRKVAQKMLGSGVERIHNHSSGAPLITCRTSIGMFEGAPAGPGAVDARAAIL